MILVMDWYNTWLFLWNAFFGITALYAFIGGRLIPNRVRALYPHIEMKTRLIAFFCASVGYCVVLQMEEHNLYETIRSALALMLFWVVQTGLCLGYLRLTEGNGAIEYFFRVWRRE